MTERGLADEVCEATWRVFGREGGTGTRETNVGRDRDRDNPTAVGASITNALLSHVRKSDMVPCRRYIDGNNTPLSGKSRHYRRARTAY